MRGMREFYLEDQSLSAFEALKTYTVNGGAALGEAKGLLREGYEASFFTCDVDLIKRPSELEGFHATSLWMPWKAAMSPFRQTFQHLRELPLPSLA